MPAAALLYAPDGFDTSRARLMGRHAAGEGFLRGLIRHAGFDRLVALTRGEADAEAFRRHAAALGATVPLETIPEEQFHRLAGIGCLLLPGPGLGAFAWRRRRAEAQRAFSLVGLTHTIASAGAMDALAETLVAPVQPWDAIVCTSRAVQGAVRRLLEMQGEYLRHRLGAGRLEGPALPLIPLGVDCAALAPDPAARAEWRARLAIGERDIAVLHHGRLSFHAKAHPWPMFRALAEAAPAAPAGARVVLVLSGWFADETQRRAFQDQARAAAPGLAIRLVERPPADTGLRSAADLFTLLSDNIQESFGLAPVEAMAAGLPVVGTDWDGLRDTITHGVSGFLVPTLMAGPMPDLAERHDAGQDSYDAFIAGVAQFTAVDIPAAAEAFRALIADPARRAAMGGAARREALTRFDWPVVIGRWRALWESLAEVRREARAERAPPLRGAERVPHRPDPGLLFADYPSARLAPETVLALAPGLPAEAALARLVELAGITGMAPRRDLLPGLEGFRAALAPLEAGPCRVAEMIAELPPARLWRVQRALAWLLKLGLLRRADG